MNIKIHNKNGEEVGGADLPEGVFGLKIVKELVHQVAVSKMSNRRPLVAHTKDRGEVRGGGKKPWRQKGTGKARHGSIRSPIWVGGGVTFGPTNARNFYKKINKKMNRKALLSVLSGKAADGEMIILDEISVPSGKTKEFSSIVEKVIPGKSRALFVLSRGDKATERAARNIKRIKIAHIDGINILNILNYKYLVFSRNSLEEAIARFSSSKK